MPVHLFAQAEGDPTVVLSSWQVAANEGSFCQRSEAGQGNLYVINNGVWRRLLRADEALGGLVTLGGDVTGPAAGNIVSRITGVGSPLTVSIAAHVLSFEQGVSGPGPTISQIRASAGVNGTSTTIKAQDGGTGNTSGGPLILQSGALSGTGSVFNGAINFVLGAAGTVAAFDPTSPNNGLFIDMPNITFGNGQTPKIWQQDAAVSVGNSFFIQAQNASTTGGTLFLSSGTGATAGNVTFRLGAFAAGNFSAANNALNLGVPNITWGGGVVSPKISQAQSSTGDGNLLAIEAQSSIASGNHTGGSIFITTGSGFGSGLPGVVALNLGLVASVNFAVDAGVSVISFSGDGFAPTIQQTNRTSGSGTSMFFRAQSTLASGSGGGIVMVTGAGNILGNPSSGSFDWIMGGNVNSSLSINPSNTWTLFSGIGATGSPITVGDTTHNNEYELQWDNLVTTPAPDVGAGAALIGGLRVDVNGAAGFIPIYVLT